MLCLKITIDPNLTFYLFGKLFVTLFTADGNIPLH